MKQKSTFTLDLSMASLGADGEEPASLEHEGCTLTKTFNEQ